MGELAEWTVLVFLNAKNDLEPFAFPNLNQMASIGSTPEVNLVVEMGRPKVHWEHGFGAWSKTLRFHVQKGMQPVEAQAVEDLGDTNMGDARTLAAFVAWGREKYPAKRTMLVIWNHGQGWRLPRPDGAPPRPEGPVVQGGYRSVSNDDDTGDKLYNRAIQDALTELLGDERIDVISFDACLMAMVETAYALRDVAKVMVASEELEPGSGWDYRSWLKPLVAARGDVDAEGLGRLMVEGMRATYGDLDETTLSSVRLDRAAALGAAISRFADAAIPHLTAANARAFREARDACSVYGEAQGMHSIDLGLYMQRIAASPLDAAVRDRAGDVLTALDACVADNYASALRDKGFGSNGLAIYFPQDARAHQRDVDNDGYDPKNTLYPVEFVQKERWAAFLHAHLEVVK